MKNKQTDVGSFATAKLQVIIVIAMITVIGTVLAGCASMILVSVETDTVTGPAQVRQFGAIDPRDITVYGVYKDESRKQVSISRSDITFDNSRAGPQTVNVRTSAGTVSFQTEVMALTGITVASQPNPDTLKLGVAVNAWPGLQIQGAWDGMGSANINTAECQITGLDINRAGRQTVTVSYQGKTAAFNVNVVDVQSIRIASAPAKVTYSQGEALALAGLSVVGTWPGLPEEAINITSANVTGYNPQTVGRQTVTVTYRGKTATFNVEVLSLNGILNGTWKTYVPAGVESTYISEWTFNNGTFVFKYEYVTTGQLWEIRGTYTIAGVNGKVTFTRTSGQEHNLPGSVFDNWDSFTIEIDPRDNFGLGDVMKGTFLRPVIGGYSPRYIKQ